MLQQVARMEEVQARGLRPDMASPQPDMASPQGALVDRPGSGMSLRRRRCHAAFNTGAPNPAERHRDNVTALSDHRVLKAGVEMRAITKRRPASKKARRDDRAIYWSVSGLDQNL